MPSTCPQSFIDLPKVELHVHMEGSIRPETLLKLAKKNGVSLPADTVEGLREWYVFRDFEHFVEIYVAISNCIKTPEDIELITREFLDGQAAQNVVHSEVTYTACTIKNLRGIPWDEQFDALKRGMKYGLETHGVTMGLILDIVRGDSPDIANEVSEWAVSGHGEGVLALGLAGSEARDAARPYVEAFAHAKKHGLPIIPHAGETQGPESIWEALELCDPPRIGHGIRCLDDPALVEELKKRGTVLEVCPTSNVCLTPIASIADHPIQSMIDAGLNVTINSDDPPMFNTTLSDEYHRVSEAFGWDMAVVKQMARNALEWSYLPDDAKANLRSKFE
ncbi:MAG: adenosine deaminase [Fimbriimonadaceae bacterium]